MLPTILSVDTGESDYPALITIWSADAKEELACNDDVPYPRPKILFEVKSAQTVLIEVTNAGGNTGGSLVLNVKFLPLLPNDKPKGATPITTFPFTHRMNTESATISSDGPYSCGGLGYFDTNSVWYHMKAAENGVVVVDTRGSNYEIALSAWSEDLSQKLQCDPPGLGNQGTRGYSQIILKVKSGETVLFKVSDLRQENEGGELVLNVRLGESFDLFESAIHFSVQYSRTRSVAINDFNGDGNLDLLTSGDSNASILLGAGTGSFGWPTDFWMGDNPLSTAIGDLNDDGNLDIAVTNSYDDISILPGTGTGLFGLPKTIDLQYGSRDFVPVAIGDFNSDGISDLVTVGEGGNIWQWMFQSDDDVWQSDYGIALILLGTGNGAFELGTRFQTGSYETPASVAIGDFNEDGISDLVTANEFNSVSILLGTGLGSFKSAAQFLVQTDDVTTYSLGDSDIPRKEYRRACPASVVIGDFNGDGHLDLATANKCIDTVAIFLGTGTGSFGSAMHFTVGRYPQSIVVGDFNGDGNPDLATTNTFNSIVGNII